ncbi:hypothetical protein [Herbaspirillum sp. RV1423]|uniref:hypothetical protein n=1 Tax=Herbaspirillum sp. RV1423 TaxID=1443993 RepID=UPI0004B3F627|nr:hypothetical protein [Herbaspirillum sp. RV1423]
MKTAYPLGALLGLLVILLLQCVVMPTIDARAKARYEKQQLDAKVAANKRLFQKLYSQAEAMTFPVSSYPTVSPEPSK